MRVVICIILLFSYGCSSLSNEFGRKQAFTKVSHAFSKALTARSTWVPAAGAVLFTIDDYDEKVSDWAVRHNPVFGSVARAEKRSGQLLDVTRVFSYLCMLSAPKRKTGHSLFKRLIVNEIASSSADGFTGYLKERISRQRPDNSGDNGFPSGHATRAFSAANSMMHSVYADSERSQMGKVLFTSWGYFLASGTAWARIESQKHYPSDVLASAAFASFFTTFLHELLLKPQTNSLASINVSPHADGLLLNMKWIAY